DYFSTTSSSTTTTLPPVIISSEDNPLGVNWDVWGLIEECDQNDYVVGFCTKYQPLQGVGLCIYDDTALYGVELICSNGKKLKSSVEKILQNEDNTATNIIRLKCLDGSNISSLEGEWSTSIYSKSCPYGAIVGLETQVHENATDNTALNNIKFICKAIN
ncbi:unnamed protein product, partial [Brachionus calyciflorus]